MKWLQAYRFRHFLRTSLWVVPALGMVAALVSIRVLVSIDQVFMGQSELDPESARALMGTLASSVLLMFEFFARCADSRSSFLMRL
jgi:flagellar motor component MotA